ncbi:MAG: DUF4407 domain-containing protein [Mycobacterium sp.]
MRAFSAAEPSLESRWPADMMTVLYGALAALVAGLALAAATSWSVPTILSSALAFGVLVAVSVRLTARGPIRGWRAVSGRAAIAVAVGVLVGEIAALAVFAGAIDRSLDDAAARSADAVPAVAQAADDLSQSRTARTDLDVAVEQSRARLDEALVVARCEYNPTSACPQTRITGTPGLGPETRTANELLADARQDLDDSLGARERRAPELDAAIAVDELELANARTAATTNADRGLGARWVAMNDHTLASPDPFVLRLFTIAFSVLLSLLPLILTLWRGETAQDRRASARAEREDAELKADTAIAVKRSEVRQTAEILWAEQQLASARLAVEAQHEIDRAHHRRRVTQALTGGIPPALQPGEALQQEEIAGPVGGQLSEPKALDARAAALPSGEEKPLPARVESEVAKRGQPPVIPSLPDLGRSAARWIRPLVPPIVAKAIDTTTHPVRTARQVFEEVEEIHFSLRRTHSVSVHSTDSPPDGPPDSAQSPQALDFSGDDERTRGRVESAVIRDDLAGTSGEGPAAGLSSGARDIPLGARDSRALAEPAGSRQLPSAD